MSEITAKQKVGRRNLFLATRAAAFAITTVIEAAGLARSVGSGTVSEYLLPLILGKKSLHYDCYEPVDGVNRAREAIAYWQKVLLQAQGSYVYDLWRKAVNGRSLLLFGNTLIPKATLQEIYVMLLFYTSKSKAFCEKFGSLENHLENDLTFKPKNREIRKRLQTLLHEGELQNVWNKISLWTELGLV